jgi:RNA polymerase sigma-70 factor (ECF subfamily)
MNSQEEFLSLLLQHQHDIRAFIGSIVRDVHARDDLFQEVALILWRKFDQFDRSRSFGAWARGIAMRKIMQTFEKNKRLPVHLAPEAIEAVAAAYDTISPSTADQEAALRHCLEKLPGKSRHLIELRYNQQLKLKEVAQRVQSTMDAVHKALSRLRLSLRTCMEKQLAYE